MAFNPHSDQSRGKLCAVLKASKQEMEKALKERLKAYQEMLGKHSPYRGVGERAINLLDLAKTIYCQFLIPSNPRSSLTPRRRDIVPDAYAFELAINSILGEEYVNGETETAVVEAMFSPLGVMKVFLDADDVFEIDGMRISTGTPKLKAVTFDNWVQDMSASHPNMVAFCGDRYQMEWDDALGNGMFDPDVVQKLGKPDPWARDYSSQDMRDIRYNEDYREMLDLWDIWMPREGLLLTLSGDFDSGPPLRVVEWSGPKGGPYERLFFGPTPGNSLPNPPVATWIDLHETENRIWNKLTAQALRQKTNDVMTAGSSEDAKIIKKAQDGEYLVLSDARNNMTIRSGGPDQINLALATHIKQLFDYMAGNLSGLGGLQAMSGTAKQDQMLTEGASQRLRQMQSRVRDFMRRLTRQIAVYLWESPLTEIPIQKRVGDMTIQSTWNREQMHGEFPDYLIDIDPYSLGDRTPQERLAQLDEHWRVDVPNLLPIAQAQGMMPSVEAYVKAKARLSDLPELETMWTYAQGEMIPSNDDMTKKPNATTRTYERVSKSGGMSSKGQDQQFMADMLQGAKSNGA
mgnify:CR=1 FL=1